MIVNAQRVQRDWNRLRGRLVMIKANADDGGEVVRVHVIEVADPDPAVPDRVTYRDYGESFVCRWWELGDQLIERGIGMFYIAGRVMRSGTSFMLGPATEPELAVLRRAYEAWAHEVDTLNGGAERAMMALRDEAHGPTTAEG